MKKLVTIMAIVLAFTAVGCNDNDKMTTWGLTAPDSDVNLRIGRTIGDTGEVFGEIGYNSSSLNNEGQPDRFGGGFIYHLTQELRWEDTPDPSPLASIFNTLQARPYVGIACMTDRGTQVVEGKYIVGTTFADNPDMPWAFVVEWQAGDGMVTASDDEAVFLGARLKF